MVDFSQFFTQAMRCRQRCQSYRLLCCHFHYRYCSSRHDNCSMIIWQSLNTRPYSTDRLHPCTSLQGFSVNSVPQQCFALINSCVASSQHLQDFQKSCKRSVSKTEFYLRCNCDINITSAYHRSSPYFGVEQTSNFQHLMQAKRFIPLR
jgi:hypothetical protein